MDKDTPPTQPTIEEVQKKFESWRKVKRNHREPIPRDLWQAAADLARKYSVAAVSKELGLSYMDLKERAYGRSRPGLKDSKSPSFVELGPARPHLFPETILEMENPKGSKIRISFKGGADFDFTALAETFLKKLL